MNSLVPPHVCGVLVLLLCVGRMRLKVRERRHVCCRGCAFGRQPFAGRLAHRFVSTSHLRILAPLLVLFIIRLTCGPAHRVLNPSGRIAPLCAMCRQPEWTVPRFAILGKRAFSKITATQSQTDPFRDIGYHTAKSRGGGGSGKAAWVGRSRGARGPEQRMGGARPSVEGERGRSPRLGERTGRGRL